MTENNKQLVETAWRAYVAGDPAEAFACMAPDVRWIFRGEFPGMSSVVIGHAPLKSMKDAAVGLFPEGLKQEIRSVIGDGDTVVLEYRAYGRTANGRYYDNEYCAIFTVKDGKIQEVREFTDTQRITKIVFG